MRAWEEFVKRQEREIGVATTRKWLTPMKVLKHEKNQLLLEAQDAFQAVWFEEQLRSKVEREIKGDKGRPLKIKVQLAPTNLVAKAPFQDLAVKESGRDLNFTPDSLDPYALFPQFVKVEESQMAFKVLSEISGFDALTGGFKKPTMELGTFNPIYLHGPKGVGKTHLLMAAARALSRLKYRVFYARAESFTEHVISAMRTGKMAQFREAYRHVDVLIIDDVHLLARKNATQEELFHTFNTLHTAGKQIIVSSNCPPRLLQDIEERLVSRFEWGISLPLEALGKEELRQILTMRSEMVRFPLSRDIVDAILENFKSAPAVLSALNTLILRSHLSHKSRLNLKMAQGYLEDLIKKEQKAELNSTSILKTVAEVFGIKTDDILGKSQCREFVLPRQIAMYLCREKLKMPYTKIGHVFSRDHSTVMTSVRSITKSLSNQDKDISSCLTDIQRRVINL